MKKIYATNGSPRKNGNTAQLLQKALDGGLITAEEAYMKAADKQRFRPYLEAEEAAKAAAAAAEAGTAPKK
jgi:multimeric flavodoxin WrbA